ncbi:cleavage and polyadenylation specificity factor subunit 1-like isoform X2 [Durio zibethinus]|uniref:Cleavage and polyadenylation specificity factor subunit 1-like isoform X2 n=1 Tax=Durio zibethinus TaxID=66656 RepID=A0A6P5Y3P6_DURZI|nr:cleavage and polyadenylation specificity factor subunit 1-like isoform X2 [Durio zibethinus]
MSYATYKMMHWPNGIEYYASGFVTHCIVDFTSQIPLNQTEHLESEWPSRRGIGTVSNLIVTAANILKIYAVRVQEEGSREAINSTKVKPGGVMDGESSGFLSSLFAVIDCTVMLNSWRFYLQEVVMV